MMHITEDTPPDMLAGAMDLTVHLPSNRSVKMSVERSTPMMDVLVQITTAHHLQLSGFVIEALGMAPSSEHSDKILPYKPNTPIGTLDTQHIRVVPKARTLPVPKNVPPGHQPFESTFRLKVHLPRKQLFVSRVSMNVNLGDIMRKVCDEKNLDPLKYEFRHPENHDDVLDPKLTLSDYQITEIYVVSKGSARLSQAFSASDIMALRKDEERKHSKSSGGVFNLIFKRGKTSNGSGSLSSENRSISPTHSDDSRSVTPPAIQQQIIKEPAEKPKLPQRKRRPAPKPPQTKEESKTETETVEKNADNQKKSDNGLTICHSRNSSDSSGYHEASILSDNANMSLPRRPQTMLITDGRSSKLNGEHSKSTSNLSAMSSHSKSTSSLAFAGRKKKAPPPPPVLKSASSVTNLEKASPVVASPVEKRDLPTAPRTLDRAPVPLPRQKLKFKSYSVDCYQDEYEQSTSVDSLEMVALEANREDKSKDENEPSTSIGSLITLEHGNSEKLEDKSKSNYMQAIDSIHIDLFNSEHKKITIPLFPKSSETNEMGPVTKANSGFGSLTRNRGFGIGRSMHNLDDATSFNSSFSTADDTTSISSSLLELISDDDNDDMSDVNVDMFESKKIINKSKSPNFMDEAEVHNFNITESKMNKEGSITSRESFESFSSASYTHNLLELNGTSLSVEDIKEEETNVSNVNVDMFETEKIKNEPPNIMDEELGIHNFNDTHSKMNKEDSVTSRESISHVFDMQKLANSEELNEISLPAEDIKEETWVVGNSHTESLSSSTTTVEPTPSQLQFTTTNSPPESIASSLATTLSSNIETDINLSKENSEIVENEPEKIVPKVQEVKENVDVKNAIPNTVTKHGKPVVPLTRQLKVETPQDGHELDSEWQYQLPSPPTAFRDSSPAVVENLTVYDSTDNFKSDSVVTSPELFEKLKLVKETRSEPTVSEVPSVVSEEEKPIFNKLSLENLEKRKSLVYNRELATSFKYNEESLPSQKSESMSSKRSSVMSELEEVISAPRTNTLNKQSSVKSSDNFIHSAGDSNLPNFKITTYDMPKQKINIFEDDSIRSTENSAKFAPMSSRNISNLMKNSYIGRSMENISYRKGSLDDGFKKPQEYNKYKAKTLMRAHTEDSVERSDSFSTNGWVPRNPVKRSKSQIALNQYKESKNDAVDGTLSKSNSLFDVSGLQSLEVMRLIQTKLNTPSNSTEELDKPDDAKTKMETVQEIKVEKPVEKPQHYYTPPSINLGTWSERPKSQIQLKEDTDYKINLTNSNGGSNDFKNVNEISVRKRTDYSGVNVKVNGFDTKPGNVSIKVNGSEPITTQSSGNVIIKIGSTEKAKDDFGSRFINHTTAAGYRKPLGNINKQDRPQRPHSVAYDSGFDISRVPIVRSVELKKPFQSMHVNTSITQICPQNDDFQDYNESKSLNYNVGNAVTNRHTHNFGDSVNKPVVRMNSFSQNGPVVKGFKQNDPQFNTYKTLPSKPTKISNDSFSTNQNVPFSQCILRRTDSNKNLQTSNNNNVFGNVVLRNTSNSYNQANRFSTGNIITPKSNSKTPPPPVMPKMTSFSQMSQTKQFDHSADPRDELLSAIRNFGGKKGLKTVKV